MTRLRRALAKDPPIIWFVLLAFVVFVAGSIVVVHVEGGPSYWPALFAGFGGSLVAFVLALSWDHERERRRLASDADDLRSRLSTEARRRLIPIRTELERNRESLDGLVKWFKETRADALVATNPQILDGAWTANAPRLSEILNEYELVGDLAATYGRLEELRWRLRERTTMLGHNRDVATTLAKMTKPLVGELAIEIRGVIDRVDVAVADPPVQPRGTVVPIVLNVAGVASLSTSATGSAAIGTTSGGA